VASILFNYQYPLQQFFNLGGFFIGGMILLLLAPNLLPEKVGKPFKTALNASALLLSVLSILQAFGISIAALFKLLSGVDFPSDLSLSLAGSPIIAIQFLSAVALANLLDRKNWKESWLNISSFLSSIVATAILTWAILPGHVASITQLPFNAGVSIARSSLSVSKTALLGYGPNAYANAFFVLKPVWLNTNDYWQLSFDSANNWPLTLLVTTGILGTAAWYWLVFRATQLALRQRREQSFLTGFILALGVWQLFAPVTALVFSLYVLALVFLLASNPNFSKEKSLDLRQRLALLPGNTGRRNFYVVASIFSLLLLVGATAVSWRFAKSYLAQYRQFESVLAESKNDINTAYSKLAEAKNLDMYSDGIRRDYAALTMNIVLALANKSELSATEQEQLKDLATQAMSDANDATILDPYNYANWLTLAGIYSQFIGSNDQALQSTYLALSQAASVNPNDPSIRFQLGQIFFEQKQYNEAITFFSQAAERKTDLAAPYYWLAKALVASNQGTDANTAYLKALTLLDPESDDYKTVSQEYEQFKAEASQSAQQQSSASKEASSAENTGLGELANPSATASENLGQAIDDQDLQSQTPDKISDEVTPTPAQ
jgi:tetratricopeptide (TPR) repeat protein